jgi:hypothetical protein
MSTQMLFSIPAGLHRMDPILALNRQIQTSGKDVVIQAYDTVQGLQWNGGRLLFNREFATGDIGDAYAPLTIYQLKEAVARVKRLNDEGIGFNFAFNSTMESVDTDEEDANFLLQSLHNGMNSVTVATESLRRHIRASYPKYEITASICFAYQNVEQYVQACNRYDKVVLLPTFAYEFEKLEGLPIEKLVFIVNDPCYLFCTRKEHYDNISRATLFGHNTVAEQAMNAEMGNNCLIPDPRYQEKLRKTNDPKLVAHINKIREKQFMEENLSPHDCQKAFNITPAARRHLIEMGVRNFKLQGRDDLKDDFQKKVIEMVEKIVYQEL